MARVLKLYNSYLRCVKEARLSNGKLIEVPQGSGGPVLPKQASLYICGPTVYSESHLGHALTYIRSDLFRRIMKSIFGVRLTTVMNITDIDDKILAKADQEMPCDKTTSEPENHPFNKVSEKYYKSFLIDMNLVRVAPPDLSVMVSKQIGLIMNYIRHLEKNGYAYQAYNGDIYFKVSSLANYQSRTDERVDRRSQMDKVKHDVHDFALWKAAKPGEPVWFYKSPLTGTTLPGRPGWHVQCSAISSAIFGKHLDFHFGGKDLIFPHHYNEQACCCAYYNLDTSKNFHVWTENWLHSGHLVLRDEKMSKSLGNVVGIKSFINETSVNALRLLCIESHYRADVNFNSELLQNMRSLDHKIGAFIGFISDLLSEISRAPLDCLEADDMIDLESDILRVQEDILNGICDDLDLSRGLYSILNLSKTIYGVGSARLTPKDTVILWHLLVDWSSMYGLDYGSTNKTYTDQALVNLVKNFRQSIRDLVVEQMKRRKREADCSKKEDAFLKSLLDNCDKARAKMDELGIVIRDGKT